MSFHSLMAVHVKEEVERLLKNSSLTNEYHTDQVLLALYPGCMYVVLYTARPVTMKQYLIENGFVAANNTTMVYKDIVNIKVITDRAEYDVEKIRNFKINSINLKHVIKQMAKNGYRLPQMYTDLEKLATFK